MSEAQPLTNEQIWDVPEDQIPEPDIRDYFDLDDGELDEEFPLKTGIEDEETTDFTDFTEGEIFMKAEITFFEPLLGTLAGDEEIATDYILTKHPNGIAKDELKALDGLEKTTEKASTLFSRNAEGKPILWDYQIKGFLKDACEAMISTETVTKEELKTARLTRYLYKKTIDKQIFISPRRILLELPKGCDPNNLLFKQRPLRCETMKGERIALARSEMAPVETKINIEIVCMNKKLEEYVKQWLYYGTLNGMGQWHGGGWGRFSWQELKS